MAWAVMADVMQWVDGNGDPASGYIIKAYEPGTTTPISIATDRNGGGLQASVTLNAEGKPEVSGNEQTLYIDRNYKWAIFRNASDASSNSNPFAGFYDNVPANISPFTITKTSSDTSYTITSADIGYETKLTATSSVTLNLNSVAGWNKDDEAIFYLPSATGVDATIAGSVTVNDKRVLPPGYKMCIKYEGSNIFNYTGP